MWDTDTSWFDVAVFMTLLTTGSILFGRFEEHKPRWRRLLKVAIALAIFIAIAETAGRLWAYAFLALPLVAAAYIHIWWLPKHGINGWTGEPRDRYLELVASRKIWVSGSR